MFLILLVVLVLVVSLVIPVAAFVVTFVAHIVVMDQDLLVLVLVIIFLLEFFSAMFWTIHQPSEKTHYIPVTLSKLSMTVLSSSLSKLVSLFIIHIFHYYSILNDSLILDVAVNVEGGATNVDRNLVAELLKQIVVLLKVAILDLKAVVELDLILNGVIITLKDLAQIIADLIIVRNSFLYILIRFFLVVYIYIHVVFFSFF